MSTSAERSIRPCGTVNSGGLVMTAINPMKCRIPNRRSASRPMNNLSPSRSTNPSDPR